MTREPRSVYFIGIGGIGMSALARYFHTMGWSVSGSDTQKSTLTQELNKEGIKVKIGQKKAILPSHAHTMAIYNRAIRHDNPEFESFKAAGIPLLPYAEVLGELTREYETIAITGSHGKSTTTALASLALVQAGLDPTVLIGTKLKDLGGKNIRIGKGPYLVLEADDYQAAFLHYSPSISIVTNIDREHMDFYKTFTNVTRAFLEFLSRTRPHGLMILNKDDAPLYSLKAKIAERAKKKKVRVIWYSAHDAAAKSIRKHLILPGAHNLSNALAVWSLGTALHIPKTTMLKAFGSYRGAWRRMEYRGVIPIGHARCNVFDDYAHHPSEIKATLAAFREKFRDTPLFVVFQPHQAKRLEALFKEFQSSFDDADALWITPIYTVRGRDEVATHDSPSLVRAMQHKKPDRLIFYLENLTRLKSALTALAKTERFRTQKEFVLLMMGAGNIVDTTNKIVQPQ